jgi:hypothetical protein
MRDTTYFSDFFVVNDPASKKSFRGKIENDIGDFGQLLRADVRADYLSVRHLEGGREPSPLFWNTVCDPFCVTDDLLNILRANDISGWSTIPVTVVDKNGKTWDNFSVLTVQGRADAVDYLQSDVVFKQMPGGIFPSFKGLYFKRESWDGSDIFMTRADSYGKQTAFVYATRRLVEVFRKSKIKNISFINFNDYEISCSTITIGANENLKHLLADKIAKASA